MAARLLLVPTPLELERLQSYLPAINDPATCRVELCGFGVIAAAANTARMLQTQRPEEVILAGVAGAYDETLPIGTAHWFDRVICHGIGAGEGASFVSAGQLGWQHHPSPAIGDRIELSPVDAGSHPKVLVTVCSASDSRPLARNRVGKATHGAEDMETFAVAVACQIARVPLRVVRGISNLAGNRDHSTWRIDDAIRSVANELATALRIR